MNINIDNVITVIGNLTSAFIGYKVSEIASKNTVKLECIKTQFYHIYLPLFKAFENNLYKEIDKETAISYIELFRTIKDNYYEYIDSSLLSSFDNFEKEISSSVLTSYHFSSICYIVDKQYEKLKKKLYLPKRRFFDKFTHNQFPKDTLNYIRYFLNAIPKFFYSIFWICVILYIWIFIQDLIRLILSFFTY